MYQYESKISSYYSIREQVGLCTRQTKWKLNWYNSNSAISHKRNERDENSCTSSQQTDRQINRQPKRESQEGREAMGHEMVFNFIPASPFHIDKIPFGEEIGNNKFRLNSIQLLAVPLDVNREFYWLASSSFSSFWKPAYFSFIFFYNRINLS